MITNTTYLFFPKRGKDVYIIYIEIKTTKAFYINKNTISLMNAFLLINKRLN